MRVTAKIKSTRNTK